LSCRLTLLEFGGRLALPGFGGRLVLPGFGGRLTLPGFGSRLTLPGFSGRLALSGLTADWHCLASAAALLWCFGGKLELSDRTVLSWLGTSASADANAATHLAELAG